MRYGTADFLYIVVLARGSTNFCLVLARLGWLFVAAVKISLWRDLVAVDRANFLQSWVRLASSRSKPRSRSCSVREGAQCPTMAAMATRWHRSRDLAWARVRLECHTGQAISMWTLPSAFQYSRFN